MLLKMWLDAVLQKERKWCIVALSSGGKARFGRLKSREDTGACRHGSVRHTVAGYGGGFRKNAYEAAGRILEAGIL